jgi:hypothetical protein
LVDKPGVTTTSKSRVAGDVEEDPARPRSNCTLLELLSSPTGVATQVQKPRRSVPNICATTNADIEDELEGQNNRQHKT